MAVTPAVTQQILVHLERDRASNFYHLQFYLKSILARRAVSLTLDDKTVVDLSPQEAWDIIAPWAASAEVGLPVETKRGLKTGAGRLLSYIEINIVGAGAEAAASYYSLLEQAKNPLPLPPSGPPELDSYAKATALRQELFSALNTKFLGGLTTKLEQTKYLQRIPDVRTRSLVAAFLAANSANLRAYNLDATGTSDLPPRLNQLLLSRAGDEHVNEAIHLAYSEAAEPELVEVVDTINSHITQVYGNNDAAYRADQTTLHSLSALSPTLNDVGSLVRHLSPHASAADQLSLTQALRAQIVASARGQHQSGQTLLVQAFRQASLAGDPTILTSLAPILEELQISTRQELLGSQLFDRDPRLLATYSLAVQTGVSPSVPWLKPQDLTAVQTKLLAGTTFTDPETALSAELGKTVPSPAKIAQLRHFLSLKQQYSDYQARLSSSPLLATQDLLAKTSGNWTAFRQPADRLLQKVWRGVDKVDDVLNWPTRKLSEGIDKLVDKTTITVKLRSGKKLAIPLLSPVSFVYNQWVNLQKGVALRLFRWSHKLALSGQWYSASFRQIADFSRAFFKSDASWGRASFLFVERKWGNLLNWTAQKVFKQETFAALKKSIGASIKAFATKIAPNLTLKITALITEAGLSSTGVGLILLGAQILWEVGKFLFQKLRDFITNAGGFRDKVLAWLPLAVGAAASWIIALPAVALGGVAAFFSGVLAGLAALFTSLAPLFVLSLAAAGGLLAGTALLYQISIKTVPDLDVEYKGPASAANLGPSHCDTGTALPGAGSPGIPTKASHIVSDLYPGFWNYCNRPTNPEKSLQYLGTADVPAYPSEYTLSNRPNLFDYVLFGTTPDPSREQIQASGNALYWCTYLVQHSFRESGNSSLANTLWSPTMEDDFRARHKFVEAAAATPQNVQPGAVIFFKTDGGPDRTNHVGVVNTVQPGMVTFYQSNAPTKSGVAEFNGGLQGPPGMPIVGIGNP